MGQVDVVIPCYNYARFLPQSVNSVLSQDVDVRVLIIDDCSTDNTEIIGRSLSEQDRRVEFRRHTTNRGHIATYNEGLLGWASADYSLLLSADDALAPGALARATRVMERHPEAGMTYGMALVIRDDESHTAPVTSITNEYQIVSSSDFLRYCFINGNAVDTPTAVVRTELQHRLGGYRADLPHSGDMEMWMRFAVHAPVGVLHSVQAYYRKHSGNMSHQYYRQLLGDKREILQVYEHIFTQWGARFPDSGLWRETMLQRLGRGSCLTASHAFDLGNTEGYRTCLEFAEQVYPKIRGSKVWWKLRVKGLFGQALWQRVLPARNRLGGFRKILSGPRAPMYSETAQLSGWWPGSPEC